METVVVGAKLQAWLLAGAILLLVAIAHAGLGWWTSRRKRARQRASPTPGQPTTLRHWIARGLIDTLPPVAFLLWLHGLFMASTLLLADFPQTTWVERCINALGWARSLGTLLGSAWLLARATRTIEALLQTFGTRSGATWDDVILPFAGRALRLVLPLVVVILGLQALALPERIHGVAQVALSLVLVGTIGFLAAQFVNALARLVLQKYDLGAADNRQARGVYTQVMVLRKIAVSVIALLVIASMLMVFQPVRQLGTAMLASAGVAGIVIGFAAQKSLGTLLAGFQIAMTQPIRIDDVVVVEGEWGKIEEITLTYVVVGIWDLRRLVVPITYFIEKPFQNWTRTTSDIIGTVFLQVDYGVPVEAVRQEFTRILEASPLWDRKVNVLQVTDAKERTLELRALASSSDAGKSWDLRCEVREKLVAFIAERYPGSLPRVRATVDRGTRAATASGGQAAAS